MKPRPPFHPAARPERLPFTGPDGRPPGKRAVIALLRERLARFEGALAPGRLRTLSLGLPAVERALPWGGLPRGCLHEVMGEAVDGAATGFCAALLGRLSRRGPVLWITPHDDLFAPGLMAFGLRPARLLVVRARRRSEVLWALEEGLRTPALAAALAEVDRLSPIQSRRLQLAAESSGVTGLLLRRDEGPGAAVTRWRVGVAPSRGEADGRRLGPGAPRWRIELVRCRGGGQGAWTVEWRRGDWRQVDDGEPAGAVAVAAEPGDRPPRPPPARGVG